MASVLFANWSVKHCIICCSAVPTLAFFGILLKHSGFQLLKKPSPLITRCCGWYFDPSHPLLNNLLLLAKLYIWDCRRNQILPNITGFKFKVSLKYEVELNIESYAKKKRYFKK